jgi:hypothetical protein
MIWSRQFKLSFRSDLHKNNLAAETAHLYVGFVIKLKFEVVQLCTQPPGLGAI